MTERTNERALKQILEDDSRYDLPAYKFVLEALNQVQHGQTGPGGPTHVDGEELLEGLKDLGLQQFGPLAGMVFRSWGVRSTEDFGHIVFNLVEAGMMKKRNEDSIDDFQNGFDIDSVFWEEFEEEPLFAGNGL